MREIEVDKVKDKVKELFLRANYHIGEDVLMALKEAREKEVSETGRSVLNMLLKNYKIASDEEIAICQDTGLAVLYVEIGQEVHIIGGNFEEAINEGVKEAYVEGYLRKSTVDDPVFARKNTGTNTPAIIYTSIVPGDKIKFMVTPKGFGSENMSALSMMKPFSIWSLVISWDFFIAEEASSLNSSLVLFILATPCSIAFNPTATASWINISVSPIVGIIYSSLSPFSSA